MKELTEINELKAQLAFYSKEIGRLQSEARYWQDAYFQQKDMVDRLSLDLGLKDRSNA